MNFKASIRCFVLLLGWIPAVVQAQDRPPAVGGVAALKVGGSLHGLFSELGPAVSTELEGGVHLLGGRLEVVLGAGWDRPSSSGSGDDSRFDAGSFSWNLDQDFLMFHLCARYRFLDGGSGYNVYAGAGPRLLLMRTVVQGTSGDEALGENRQTETRLGVVLQAGGEYKLGPGAVLLEMALGVGSLEGLITGESSSSALTLLVGYRYRF